VTKKKGTHQRRKVDGQKRVKKRGTFAEWRQAEEKNVRKEIGFQKEAKRIKVHCSSRRSPRKGEGKGSVLKYTVYAGGQKFVAGTELTAEEIQAHFGVLFRGGRARLRKKGGENQTNRRNLKVGNGTCRLAGTSIARVSRHVKMFGGKEHVKKKSKKKKKRSRNKPLYSSMNRMEKDDRSVGGLLQTCCTVICKQGNTTLLAIKINFD